MPPKEPMKRKKLEDYNGNNVSKSVDSLPQHSPESERAASQREVIELSYVHTIHKFNLLPEKTGEILTSPVFSAKSHPSIQWHLQIYPRGDCEETNDHLSVFVARVNQTAGDLPVTARCKITILSNGKEIISQSTERLLFNREMTRDGWSKFLSLDKLTGNDGINQATVTCNLSFEVQHVLAISSSKYLIFCSIYFYYN